MRKSFQRKNKILCILGNEPVMEHVYERLRFGYFTAALPGLLEKNGILDFDVAPPDALENGEMLDHYDVLIVGWLPAVFWKTSYVRSLWQYEGAVILEGPFPPMLESYLGIRMTGRHGNSGTWRSDSKEITVSPRVYQTKPIPKTAPAPGHKPEILLKRWDEAPYWLTAYEAVGASVDATISDGPREWVGTFHRSNFLGFTFQVFSYVLHYHSYPEIPVPMDFSDNAHARALEGEIFRIIKKFIISRNAAFLKVHAWPAPYRYCATIRHDVDRIPERQALRRLTAFEKEKALKATWFLKPDRLDADVLEEVMRKEDEIALHSVKLSAKSGETSELARFSGTEIIGETLHHGGGADGWLGWRTVRESERRGFLYTEFMPISEFPFQFPYLDRQGLVRVTNGYSCSYQFTTDGAGVVRKGSELERDPARLQDWARRGAWIVILNHPDICFEELQKFCEALPEKERLSWTYQEVIDWWAKTHSRRSLSIRETENSPEHLFFEIESQKDIEDIALTITVPSVDGIVEMSGDGVIIKRDQIDGVTELLIRISLKKEVPATIRVHRKRPLLYREFASSIPSVKGPNPAPDYVLNRTAKLSAVLSRALRKDFRGLELLDVGASYGPATFAFYLKENPGRMVGIDIQEASVKTAQMLTKEVGNGRIAFLRSSMTELRFEDSSFDALIVNNSINYLTEDECARAIGEFYRVLRPGGAVLIMTPNRYYPKEAFSGLYGVQFLPKTLAERYVRWKGKPGVLDGIRLPSSFELERRLKESGFRGIEVTDAYSLKPEGIARHFKPRFFITAVRP